jgi:hypothetical protein
VLMPWRSLSMPWCTLEDRGVPGDALAYVSDGRVVRKCPGDFEPRGLYFSFYLICQKTHKNTTRPNERPANGAGRFPPARIIITASPPLTRNS